MKADKLTTDRGCIFSDLQGCLIGIVQPSFQKTSCFCNDSGKQPTFSFFEVKDLSSEKFHRRICAGKRDHDQIRCDLSVCLDPVKFTRVVKSDFSASESMGKRTCTNLHFSFINAYKLPEIMGFSGKRKGTHIFKIMKGKQLFYMKKILKLNSIIFLWI